MSRVVRAFVVVALFGVVGCSSEDRESVESDVRSAVTEVADAANEAGTAAAEAAVRNIATQQGEEEFTDAGAELDGPLTCTATASDGASKIDVNCTGTTKTGGAAVLTGTTNEIPGASVVELEGEFTGTVDGTQVFTTQRLGG